MVLRRGLCLRRLEQILASVGHNDEWHTGLEHARVVRRIARCDALAALEAELGANVMCRVRLARDRWDRDDEGGLGLSPPVQSVEGDARARKLALEVRAQASRLRSVRERDRVPSLAARQIGVCLFAGSIKAASEGHQSGDRWVHIKSCAHCALLL